MLQKTDKERLSDADEIIRQKLQRIQHLEKQVKEIQKHNDSEAKIREEIFRLSEYIPDPPKWLTQKRSPKLPGVPMTIWSDWHFGEQVFKEQVGGVNEFNLRIGQQRVKRLVDTTIDLCLNHMVNPEYPGVVVCLGGDMITGAIHDELAATNDGTVQDALFAVEDSLIAALTAMADAFGRVFVPCVIGNHGRDTIKPRFKNRPKQSFEWGLYHHLERHFKNDKRIEFKIPNETDYHFSVQGHTFTLTHGDTLGVKGGDGIIGVIGPIARGATKLGRSEAQIGRAFKTLLIGHYHTYFHGGDAVPVVANGSLIGYNEYARLQLRVPYSRPCQALWFMHAKHGVTAAWPIYLDGQRQFLDDKRWVTWSEQ